MRYSLAPEISPNHRKSLYDLTRIVDWSIISTKEVAHGRARQRRRASQPQGTDQGHPGGRRAPPDAGKGVPPYGHPGGVAGGGGAQGLLLLLFPEQRGVWARGDRAVCGGLCGTSRAVVGGAPPEPPPPPAPPSRRDADPFCTPRVSGG